MRGLKDIGTAGAAAALLLLALSACSSGEDWRERLRAKNPSETGPPVAIAHSEATDRALVDAIYASFFQDDVALFSQVVVEAEEGYVTLAGRVPAAEDRLRAVRLAWGHTAVRGVTNHIELEAPALEGAARDRWIANQVVQRLAVDRRVEARRFTVESVGREVYVLGEAASLFELDLVLEHAGQVPYVRRVVNLARIARDS